MNGGRFPDYYKDKVLIFRYRGGCRAGHVRKRQIAVYIKIQDAN